MQKYGFREGQGLGKHEQGLSTALSVEKTSKRGGKIIVGESVEKGNFVLHQEVCEKWGEIIVHAQWKLLNFLFAVCPCRRY